MFLAKVLSMEIETIKLSYLRSFELEISVAVTYLARSRISVLQTVNTLVFQGFLDLAFKLHVDLLLQLVGSQWSLHQEPRSHSLVSRSKKGRRKDYALVEVSRFSDNHLLFLKVCNFLVMENAVSME